MRYFLTIIFIVFLLGAIHTPSASADTIIPSDECSSAIRNYSILAYTGKNDSLLDSLISKDCMKDIRPYTGEVIFNPFQYFCVNGEEELREYIKELENRVSDIEFKRLDFLNNYESRIDRKIKKLALYGKFLDKKQKILKKKIVKSRSAKIKSKYKSLIKLNKKRKLINLLNREKILLDQEINLFELREETNFLAKQYKKSAYSYIAIIFNLSSLGCIRFPEELLKNNTFFELYTNKLYIPKRGPLENIIYDDINLYNWSIVVYKAML